MLLPSPERARPWGAGCTCCASRRAPASSLEFCASELGVHGSDTSRCPPAAARQLDAFMWPDQRTSISRLYERSRSEKDSRHKRRGTNSPGATARALRRGLCADLCPTRVNVLDPLLAARAGDVSLTDQALKAPARRVGVLKKRHVDRYDQGRVEVGARASGARGKCGPRTTRGL